MVFQSFEWCPSVELWHVAKLQGRSFQSDRKATPQAAKKGVFQEFQKQTLGSFSDHSWAALGAKVKVSAFRVVSISRVVARWKVARLKPSKQQESFGMFWALN